LWARWTKDAIKNILNADDLPVHQVNEQLSPTIVSDLTGVPTNWGTARTLDLVTYKDNHNLNSIPRPKTHFMEKSTTTNKVNNQQILIERPRPSTNLVDTSTIPIQRTIQQSLIERANPSTYLHDISTTPNKEYQTLDADLDFGKDIFDDLSPLHRKDTSTWSNGGNDTGSLHWEENESLPKGVVGFNPFTVSQIMLLWFAHGPKI
jgi:hypothetical protein